MKKQQTNKLWGAAFSQQPPKAVIAFTAGRDVASVPPADVALLPYDLWVNKAHCIMLAKQGIIPLSDAGKILEGLSEIEMLVEQGKFALDPAKEDVHTNIESWLTEKLGIEVAGKLHTARSRNDQATADTKLHLKDQALAFVAAALGLTKTLISLTKQHYDTLLPGFTHHQHAMVTTLGHVFAGLAAMILRDIKKFQQWIELHNTSPLGSVVAYGTTYPIDPAYTTKLLGFSKPAENSMDAITNRGEAEADLAYAIVSLMNHLSSLAQTLILWATPEFGMVKLTDQYSTGSSIMPQKKNPDPLEVIKGKASFAQGQLVGLLGIGKASFIGYNRDTQWTKYLIMDLVNECLAAPVVLKGILETLTVNKEVMAGWCHKGFIGATTLMEQLASHYHLPMRQAKVLVEKAVKYSQGQDKVNYGAVLKALSELKLDLKITRKEVRAWQDPAVIIDMTQSSGGPGKAALAASLKHLVNEAPAIETWLVNQQKQTIQAKALLKEGMAKVMITPGVKEVRTPGVGETSQKDSL